MNAQIDGVSAIALILIGSFAIDRIVTAVMFLLSFVHLAPEPSADRPYKLMYYSIATVLAAVILYYGHLRVLSAMKIEIDPIVDMLITGIVLIGGADSIAGLLKVPAGAAAPAAPPPPVQVTGKLTLDDATAQKVMGQKA
jgi:hypothetical protein